MRGKEVYKIWASKESKWTPWIRPVPFIAIDNDSKIYDLEEFYIPNINYIDKVVSDTAIIIDLPGNESIKEGIGLAKLGYRPVPIYNGTNEQEGAIATVNNHDIELGLIKGGLELRKIKISQEASPVFLLDSNRTNRYKMSISMFDNSWDVYGQDLPSADYFLKNGINKIIVRSNKKIQKDLKKILYKFQKKNIQIFYTNGSEEIKKIKIKPMYIKDDF